MLEHVYQYLKDELQAHQPAVAASPTAELTSARSVTASLVMALLAGSETRQVIQYSNWFVFLLAHAFRSRIVKVLCDHLKDVISTLYSPPHLPSESFAVSSMLHAAGIDGKCTGNRNAPYTWENFCSSWQHCRRHKTPCNSFKQ